MADRRDVPEAVNAVDLVGGVGARLVALRAAAIVALSALLLPSAVLSQQGEPPAGKSTLRGLVVDSAMAPVAYANVQVRNGARVTADDSGRFVLELDRPQRLTLDVRRIGFRPAEQTLEVSSDTAITILMAAVPGVLPGTRITGARVVRSLELSGFYRRLHDRERGVNSGHFITAEDIARRNPPRITQMIEGLPSVRVVRRTPPPGSRVQAPSNCISYNDPVCWVPVGPGNCPLTVYLDGRRLNDLTMNPREAFAYGVDNIALPTHVAGIEVYSSASRVPMEYQAQLNPGNCGAILIWTK
ncbi:MAG TPA: carboxypeptidase-like regulatory domain-containing protein [Gemmatimonadaceae bacterium]|nr:carboxypeptidase-like regulatory domain-containing protein [Gemmatimonadaceae bacterium]